MPHELTRSDVDLETLALELSTRIGRPVKLACRAPGTPSVLLVLDPATGSELDVPAETVAVALTAHRPPLSPDAALAAAINAVDTSRVTDTATKAALDALKAALTGNGKPAAVAGRPAR